MLVALDREEVGVKTRVSAVQQLEAELGVPIRSIVTLTDLIDHMEEDGDYADYLPAVRAYREHFRPSPQFPTPHVILGVAVVCAPTDKEADYLASSSDLAWVRRHQNVLLPFPSPEEASVYPYTAQDRAVVDANRARQFVGSPEKVVHLLRHAAETASADELMVTTVIYGKAERQRSYELLADAWAG